MRKIKFDQDPLCEYCCAETATMFATFRRGERVDPKGTKRGPAYVSDLWEGTAGTLAKGKISGLSEEGHTVDEDRYVWKFVCDECSERAKYYIEFWRFFYGPSSTVDWLAHLWEKGWMETDDFFDMMDRFRDATKSYNKP